LTPSEEVQKVLNYIKVYSPGQNEFYQAAHEVLYSLLPLLNEDNRYVEYNILERIVVPERTIIFRVNWLDDSGKIRTNLGYRVQFSQLLDHTKVGFVFTLLSI